MRLTPGVVQLGVEVEVRRARVAPVVGEAGEGARLFVHVVLRIGTAVGTEGEQLHDLACVVLVRAVLRVRCPRQPQQHRRVARHLHEQVVEVAERSGAHHLVLSNHQLRA